ncbi:hypothetical protein AOLI_G00182500 [Acnodon oligacanthus]
MPRNCTARPPAGVGAPRSAFLHDAGFLPSFRAHIKLQTQSCPVTLSKAARRADAPAAGFNYELEREAREYS